MLPCSQDFLNALLSPIKTFYIKLEFYDSSMNLLTSFEEDITKYQNFRGGASSAHFTPYGTMRKVSQKRLGGISVDVTRAVRRQFSFGLGNDNDAFTWGTDSPIWIANRIKIYTGLKLANGDIEYIPQGLFIITAPEDTHNPNDGKDVYITGQDKTYLLTDKRGKFADELTLAEGLNIGTAIQTIASQGGETMFNLDPVTDTIPYELTYQPNDTRWKAIQDLATMAQCDVFYDVNGYLRLQKIATDFSKEPSVWSFKYGDSKEMFYAGNIRSFDETNLSNHIRVIGGSSQTAIVTYDLIVDETVPYTISSTIAETSQFQAGTYTNVQDITDQNDGSIGLAQVGKSVNENILSVTDFKTPSTSNTTTNLTNLTVYDDTDYNMAPPIIAGAHIELAGYRRDWQNNEINYQRNISNPSDPVINQTKYGVGSTETINSSFQYTLSSANGQDAKSRLNNQDTTGANLQIASSFLVPNAPASGVTYAGVVYLTDSWQDADNTYGYFAGFGSDGSVNLFKAGTLLKSVSLSNSSNTPYLSQATEHFLSVTVNNGVHTVSVDNTVQITYTDATYITGGYGLRVENGTGLFVNFGIFNNGSGTNSGTRIETYNLTNVKTFGSSNISWVQQEPNASTNVVVDCCVSTDGGNTYGSWTTCSNLGQLPIFVVGQDMTNVYLQLRETLTSTDATVSPEVSQIQLKINSEYVTSGTYISNKFSITDTSTNPVDNTCFVSWTSTLPSNTTMDVQVSVSTDNGQNWSDFADIQSNNGAIGQIDNSVDLSQCLFQYKVSFSTTDPTQTPSLQDITFQVNAPIFQNSPYSIQKIGDVLYIHNNGSPDPLITNLYQAKWRAKYELMKRLGYAEQLSLEMAPMWLLDGNDVVDIEDSENSVTGNYRIQSFTLPLIPQIMQVNAVQYKNPLADWNSF